ncbi:MAG TPA: glutathione S-transferase [Xanthobacteraceae bacterium]|jgi:glutathione S-transferase|nr:glutathione S-transferase [Xanthobacteraceae bacterium]
MKLHWSPRSPFVRKVMIVAHEVGIVDRLDCVRSVAAMTKPHLELMQDNPLSKIPTLVRDDGIVLYDSRVICEYFDTLHSGHKLFPAEPQARFTALRRQALGDGMLDFLILWRGEGDRAHKSEAHLSSFAAKRAATLASLETESGALSDSSFSIGHIAVGCALSYLDFRFSAQPWRGDHPKLAAWHATFAARPSAKATEAVDDSHIKP